MTDNPCLLVIGYGNSLRRDDGAGLLLAQMLYDVWAAQGHPVRLLLAHQLGPDMALDIAAPDVAAVLFIDTAAHGPPLVELTELDAAAETHSLTHHLSPATLLLYAERLFDRHPHGWMMRVTGQDFEHGDKISAAVAEAISLATYDAERWWKALWAAPTAG
ncbi:MAG: hydrogenase maturation protease [Caldilineaceae bacterium]|nr:hydrogenase maturation protease [Caldilineaceae bacterium]